MSIDYAILGVLTSGPATGYEIKSEFDEEAQGLIWGVSQGSVYTRLRELQKKAWIEESETEAAGRGRKFYSLTTGGWKALMDWQLEPSEYPVVKDDLLLKMAYWVDNEKRGDLVEQLQLRRVRSRKLLGIFESIPTNNVSAVGEYGFLVTQYVCSKLKAELQWIELAISQLEGPPRPAVQDPHGIIQGRQKQVREIFQKIDQHSK